MSVWKSYNGTVLTWPLVQIMLCQFHYQNGQCRLLLSFTGDTINLEARNMVCMMHRCNATKRLSVCLSVCLRCQCQEDLWQLGWWSCWSRNSRPWTWSKSPARTKQKTAIVSTWLLFRSIHCYKCTLTLLVRHEVLIQCLSNKRRPNHWVFL